MAAGFPGQFQGGFTTGYDNIGAVKKTTTGAAGFPGQFQGGFTTGYKDIGAVQKAEDTPTPPVVSKNKATLLFMGVG
jgi:hypothetical protein